VEPPQPVRIQIVMPGQAERDVTAQAPPPPETHSRLTSTTPADTVHRQQQTEASLDTLEDVAGPADAPLHLKPEAEIETVLPGHENLPKPLTERQQARFWHLYNNNECFCEGYHMLEAKLSLKEIADFLHEWAASISEGRRNKLGLAMYWKRMLEWRRHVRDPRLKKKQIDLGRYKFKRKAILAADRVERDEEDQLMLRWWEIWTNGMATVAEFKKPSEVMEEPDEAVNELRDFLVNAALNNDQVQN
jgi:hypothetical protein